MSDYIGTPKSSRSRKIKVKSSEKNKQKPTPKMAMTNEQLQILIDSMGSNAIRAGSFTGCTARFNGSKKQAKVEEFITTTSIYRDIENISDENALRGLPLLLEGTASTWWQGVKTEARTWNDATTLIRKAFSPAKPKFKLYMELYDEKQGTDEDTDMFINVKRAIFAQIDNKRLDEATKIDMIFGLLHINIRQEISRDAVTSFDDLLQKARIVEQILAEKNLKPSPSTKNLNKPRCNFCNIRGHTEENCLKKNEIDNIKAAGHHEKKKDYATVVNIVCFGCGNPGFVRSNCPKCKNEQKGKPNEIEFYSIHLKLGRNVPTIPIVINGSRGIAHIDTGARISVASYSLYQHLLKNGCRFENISVNIRLADGKCYTKIVYMAKVNIEIGGRKNIIKMIIIPDARDNRTLLGIDFLEENGIILNTAQRAWSFYDTPNIWQPYDEFFSNLPNEITHANLIQTKNTSRHQATSNIVEPITSSSYCKAPQRSIELCSAYLNIVENSKIEQSFIKKTSPHINKINQPTQQTPKITKSVLNAVDNEEFIDFDFIFAETSVKKFISPLPSTPKALNTPKAAARDIPEIFLASMDNEIRDDAAVNLSNDEKFKLNSISKRLPLTALMQGENENQRTVEYASRLLKPAKISYCTTENFVNELTTKLIKIADTLQLAKENAEKSQDMNWKYMDNSYRPDPKYNPSDKVWVAVHMLSNAAQQRSSKLAPKRDGPYIILAKHGTSCYVVAHPDTPTVPISTYHTSMLTPVHLAKNNEKEIPTLPIRRRGRPKKKTN